MTEQDKERINRILLEASAKPPKLIYPDDALFLIEMIWTLLKRLGVAHDTEPQSGLE